jgi:RNA recognition motif-containing protein
MLAQDIFSLRNSGFCLVRFVDADSADAALNMNELVLLGRNVIVKSNANSVPYREQLHRFADWTVEHSVADMLRPIKERRRVWVGRSPMFPPGKSWKTRHSIMAMLSSFEMVAVSKLKQHNREVYIYVDLRSEEDAISFIQYFDKKEDVRRLAPCSPVLKTYTSRPVNQRHWYWHWKQFWKLG